MMKAVESVAGSSDPRAVVTGLSGRTFGVRGAGFPRAGSLGPSRLGGLYNSRPPVTLTFCPSAVETIRDRFQQSV